MIRSNPLPVCSSASVAQAPGSAITARAQLVLGACACAGATGFLFAVDPSRNAVYPPCLLYQMTGIYCAGCGATRAAYALLHGQFAVALHDNVLFIGSLPLLAWLAVPYLARAWSENRWPNIRVEKFRAIRIAAGVLTVALGFMVLRNLPGWPFDLLRPL